MKKVYISPVTRKLDLGISNIIAASPEGDGQIEAGSGEIPGDADVKEEKIVLTNVWDRSW